MPGSGKGCGLTEAMETISSDQTTAVILAGGFGTRIKHLLGDLPKPMAPVNGRPFLEWVVRWLATHNVRRVVLSTGYLAETIEAHFRSQPVAGVQVACVPETTPLGTAGGFLNAVHQSKIKASAWFLINGDTLAFANLAEAIQSLQIESTAGVIFGREVPDTSRFGSLVTDATGRLECFAEKRPGRGVISTGVYLFRDSLVRQFPNKVPLSLEQEVFPALTASGVSLKVLRMNTPFLDIGTPDTLGEADLFIRQNLPRFQLESV
jgi:D-glycero-alpha-D-manno-heptose 1-phosphate guanylyltransferase